MDSIGEFKSQEVSEYGKIKFVPIDETDYLKRDLRGQDYTAAKIHAFLANATYPLTVLPIITQSYETMAEGNDVLIRNSHKKEKWINSGVEYYMSHLLTTNTMLLIRDEAQELEAEFREANLSPESDRNWEYLRRAVDLHNRMEEYARIDYEYGHGVGSKINIAQDKNKIIDKPKNYVANSLVMKRDNPENLSRNLEVGFDLVFPKKGDNLWDREEIDMTIDPTGKINHVIFNELFSPVWSCGNPRDMAEAASNGEEITSYQRMFIEGHNVNDADISEGNTGINLGGIKEFSAVPQVMFIQAIPAPLREKLRGKSTSNSYATAHMDYDGITLHARDHESVGEQYTINLNTSELSNEDVWELVGVYVMTLKMFPRVSREKVKSKITTSKTAR